MMNTRIDTNIAVTNIPDDATSPTAVQQIFYLVRSESYLSILWNLVVWKGFSWMIVQSNISKVNCV